MMLETTPGPGPNGGSTAKSHPPVDRPIDGSDVETEAEAGTGRGEDENGAANGNRPETATETERTVSDRRRKP